MNYLSLKNIYKNIGLLLIFLTVTTSSLYATPLKIMLIGDSITEGVNTIAQNPDRNISSYTNQFTAQENRVSYRGKLWNLLTSAGYTFNENNGDLDFIGTKHTGWGYDTNFDIDHEGHGGFTSKKIRDNISTWVDNSAVPDIVLLHIGANDHGKRIPIGIWDDVNQDSNTSVNNVKHIIDTLFIKNPNIKIFIARIIEVRRAHSFSGNWSTKDFNDAIVTMVENHTKNSQIRIVDMEKGARIRYDPCGTSLGDMKPHHQEENNAYDYHPNMHGETKIAIKWFKEMMNSNWLPDLNNTDTIAPTMNLNGGNPQYIMLGDNYIELGAIANDNIDGDVTEDIIISGDYVETSVVGTYNVMYGVIDKMGNEATLERTVVVQDGDNPVETQELIQGGGNDVGELDTSKWHGEGMSYNDYVGTSSYEEVNYLTSNPLANNGGTYQAIVTEVGKTYTLSATLIGSNHYADINNFTLGESYVSVEDTIPTPSSTPNYASEHVSGAIPKTVMLNFRATSTITYISIRGDHANRYPNASMVSVKAIRNDTSTDILWRSGSSNHLWQMHADGSHTYKNIGTKSSSYKAKEIADFNGDGIADILWRKGYKNYIWYMNADGTHSYKKITSKSYEVVGAEDFNNDGIADILWRKDNQNHIWYMNADGTYTYKNIGTKSTAYTIVGLGDLNGDGITDILWRKGDKNYIWYMNTDGTHSYKKITSKSYNVQGIKDFNNDGIDDILWRKDNKNHIWYMNADGTYTYNNIGNKASSYILTQVGDYNGDGINDILWRKGSSNYLWYMNTDGTHTYKKISVKASSFVVVDKTPGK